VARAQASKQASAISRGEDWGLFFIKNSDFLIYTCRTSTSSNAASDINNNAASEINNNAASEIKIKAASEISRNTASEINSNAASEINSNAASEISSSDHLREGGFRLAPVFFDRI
jgi:hypothetical protein